MIMSKNARKRKVAFIPGLSFFQINLKFNNNNNNKKEKPLFLIFLYVNFDAGCLLCVAAAVATRLVNAA